MFDPVIQVVILAAIALFVLFRLYTVLGRGEDNSPVQRTQPAKPRQVDPGANDLPLPNADNDRPIFTGPAAGGLEDIYNADNSFNEATFMRGAKAAYTMIVTAFAAGDRDTLRPLLDDDVYEAWDHAIAERETTGASAFDLLRIRRAEIESAEMDGDMARIWVRYEAELGDGETTRTARELWAYMHDVTANDPNWILDDVEEAK
ncbi:Tim44/TimA family putative adaptor protein [Hyphomonas sp. UBA4494]|jgi:predicted lipid-binding transport protein (Tim44 family)|uniref:Tim44/TimA family putative adaptor protein n=1 Tax=Hyphomonas sp. UBA4494 TaxID=1946631 RepID=UPI0025C4B61A|nr:Tim44/TimA family putative adaptor protein [Hyphomonas sp. UBA4494]